MGWNPSESLVIFLVILGAACAVMIGYSLHRVLGGPTFDDDGLLPLGYDQRQYMRMVRRRNLEMLWGESRRRDTGAETPMTMTTSG